MEVILKSVKVPCTKWQVLIEFDQSNIPSLSWQRSWNQSWLKSGQAVHLESTMGWCRYGDNYDKANLRTTGAAVDANSSAVSKSPYIKPRINPSLPGHFQQFLELWVHNLQAYPPWETGPYLQRAVASATTQLLFNELANAAKVSQVLRSRNRSKIWPPKHCCRPQHVKILQLSSKFLPQKLWKQYTNSQEAFAIPYKSGYFALIATCSIWCPCRPL